ncbi:MAG: RING finger protein [Clostridia bacterium]|nr:RING finger protein [Clostridia bacterium]
MRYTSEICDKCKKEFTDNDDVVVCPVCGTPHHRACYFESGRCVHESEHGKFEWKPTKVQVVEEIEQQLSNDEKIKEFMRKRADIVAITAEDEIGEFTVKEYGSMVQKRTNKYIPEFMKMDRGNRKLSINLAPLFFPRLWLFYRKMYFLGFLMIIIPALLLTLTYSENVDVYRQSFALIQEFKEKIDNKEINANNYSTEYRKLMSSLPESSRGMRYSNRFINVASVILAFFGNYIYKFSIQRKLKYLKKKYGKDKEKEDKKIKLWGGVSVLSIVLCAVLIYVTSVLPVHVYMIEQLKSLF